MPAPFAPVRRRDDLDLLAVGADARQLLADAALDLVPLRQVAGADERDRAAASGPCGRCGRRGA